MMSLYEKFNHEITECKCCFFDINNENYVLYTDGSFGKSPAEKWKSASYCKDCIKQMLLTQWETYLNDLYKADCEAARRRLIELGPPINIRDMLGLPCTNETHEPISLYYDNQEQSAKLVGSLIGESRQKWWDQLKQNLIT